MDHRHDNRAFLESLDYRPDFVKTASFEGNPTAYAHTDGVFGLFPIHTPHDAWASAAYLEKNASRLSSETVSKVAENIGAALDVFGVEYVHPVMEKQASEADVLLKIEGEMQKFAALHRRIEPAERAKRARALLHLLRDANGSDVRVPDAVKAYGGEHLSKKWRSAIHSRSLIAPPEARKQYELFLDNDTEVEKRPPLEFAEIIEKLDKRHGMDRHWGSRLADPYHGLLGHDEPTKIQIVVMRFGGRNYHESDFASLNHDALREHMTEEGIKNALENPEDQSDVVKRIIAEVLDRA